MQYEDQALSDMTIDRLADKFGDSATIKTIFAEPVMRGNVTIVPVAKLRYGLGGQQSSTPDQKE